MGLDPTRNNKTKVSKAFGRLDRRGLIARGRSGNRGRYALLDEGGHGEPYAHPGKRGHFFKLPHLYWDNEWHLKLDLAAKAALLISLSLLDGFPLPKRQAKNCYGISPTTLQKGLSDLKTVGILKEEIVTKRSALSETGFTTESRYTPVGDFAREPHKSNVVPIKKATG